MAYLLDTNILVRWANRIDPDRPIAKTAVARLHRRGESLYVAPQNLIEFWNVSTRSIAHNGLGYPPGHARVQVDHFCRLFAVLPDTEHIVERWLALAVATGASGRRVHDARIAALMLVHGISHVLTFNVADFAKFEPFGVVAMHPATVPR